MIISFHVAVKTASVLLYIANGVSASPMMRSVISYIQEHLTETITTEQLVQVLCLSPNYLSSKFHQESGRTLRNFITQQKINKAKDYREMYETSPDSATVHILSKIVFVSHALHFSFTLLHKFIYYLDCFLYHAVTVRLFLTAFRCVGS